ncbi:inositol monophosphatase family protein [Nonomuraea sp. B1E8]|uniref:inositol monophosphatase family protein n=1 Tax=unclassified Nonomuraea TaxID=2593643 RepID=UPI00325E9E36
MGIESLWSTLERQLLPAFADYRQRLAELPVHVKDDRTLLTEADIAIQKLIIQDIRDCEPNAVIIAEEEERSGLREEIFHSDGRLWVIDPIDGTAEFVRNDRTEFCSVVCLFENWMPSAAFILAPELGSGRSPLLITADHHTSAVTLNGSPAPMVQRAQNTISATRSSGGPGREFDAIAAESTYRVKTRTTSQTIDMLRTVVDLRDHTDPSLHSFDLFWRRQQKLWDGAAGLCLGDIAKLRHCDEDGAPLPAGPEFLSAPTPVFESTVMGQPETVKWFLGVKH